MSRITGSEVASLMEAYNAVYAPQELTEEQIWEEVENWVNSLLEEGYDLSDYTWEEMYESYLEEQGGQRGSGSSASQTNQSVSGAQILYGPSGKPQSPASRPTNVRGGGTRPAARPAAPAPAARPAAPAPAAPKVSPKPAATPAPAGGSALDRATAAASKPTAFSPKPQSDVGAMIARSQARQAAQTPKPAAAPAKPMGGARGRLMSSFDPFDVIKGHLLDEGYADTEEAALAIMANMSESWKNSIIG